MDRALSILSGGLDSAVSTAIAFKYHEVSLAITFNYGQKAREAEIEAARYLCRKWNIEHRVIDLKILGDIGENCLTSKSKEIPHIGIADLDGDPLITTASAQQVWVPNRNGVFINIAAAMAEAGGLQWILTGFNREEAATFPDNSPKYIEAINRCLAESTLAKPQVVSYVGKMDKMEILKTALELKIDISRLWCCYDNQKKWCGRCESCARLKRAMKMLEVLGEYRKCFL